MQDQGQRSRARGAERRADRLAAQLRANLGKRKALARIKKSNLGDGEASPVPPRAQPSEGHDT